MNSRRVQFGFFLAASMGILATYPSAFAQQASVAQDSVSQDVSDLLSAEHLDSLSAPDRRIASNAVRLHDGRRIFRYETFGDEVFWGDTLQLHRAIAGEQFGGVGPGVSPKMASHDDLRIMAKDALNPLDLLGRVAALD